MKILNIT